MAHHALRLEFWSGFAAASVMFAQVLEALVSGQIIIFGLWVVCFSAAIRVITAERYNGCAPWHEED